MTRVAIVTDSTCDLSPDLCARYGITTVPLNVLIDGRVYRDQIDISTDEFMRRLPTVAKLPSTSQPSVGLFEETFRRLAADHDAVVAVLLSAKLSGTVQSALLARDAVAGVIPVEVVDSLNVTMGLGFQVLRAAELAERGMEAVEIARRLRAETAEYHVVFFVDTLEYLQKGGRIGQAASLLGTLLNLKPLLRIDEGQVVPFERTRTRARALAGLADFVRGLPQVARLCVLFSTTPDDAAALADRLVDRVPRDQIALATFSPVLGAHVGPGAMGVAVYEGADG